MKEVILNEQSKITQRLRIISIDCIGKLSILKTNLIGVDWNLMNIALYLDSFSMSEFCLHQIDILTKHSRRSEHVKESFGLLARI